MISVAILSAGKLKEPFYRDAYSEYAARLEHYIGLETIEIAERPETMRDGLDKEGEDFLRLAKREDFVVALWAGGEQPASEDIYERFISRDRRSVFIIGSSRGLSERVLRRADAKLSLSRMTFPRQLAKVILAEQLYRAMSISRGERYHK